MQDDLADTSRHLVDLLTTLLSSTFRQILWKQALEQMQADRARLRPILMTTLAIIAGMLPVALGRGDGSASRASLATVVVGGQALCLLVTLLVTPVIYSMFDDLRGLRAFSQVRFPRWKEALAARWQWVNSRAANNRRPTR